MAEDGYYSDDENLSTISLTTSVCDTVEYLAREYSFKLPTGLREYFLPVDTVEFDRLDYQHQLFLESQDGKLHQAPLDEPLRILDLGTGTGLWSIDIGDRYSSAEVEGIDKHCIQPHWVPPNVRFVIDDLENLDHYRRNHYDLVHAQDIDGFLPDPDRLPREVFEILVPGGYFERVELDRWTIPQNKQYPYLTYFCQLLTETLNDRGYQLRNTESLVKSMEEAGFEGIQVKKFPIVFSRDDVEYFIQSLYAHGLWFFTHDLQWKLLEYQILLVLIRNEIARAGFNPILYSVYGQKPGMENSARRSA